VHEIRVNRDRFERKVEAGTDDWMKLLQEELHYRYSLLYYPNYQTKESGRGRVRVTWCMQGFGGEARRKENT
jgi:hypothetical protein